MSRTFRVSVSIEVDVTLDDTRLDDAFMKSFAETFYDFETLAEHAAHIGQLAARDLWNDHFNEGYGKPADLGIEARKLPIREFEAFEVKLEHG